MRLQLTSSLPASTAEDPLTSHLSLSHHNLATLRALISSISLQRDSLALALSNLHRVNTGTASSFALFLEAAEPTLERYEALLAGWEGAMDAVGKVAVVAGLLTRHPQQPSGGAGASLHAREGSNASVAAATAAVGSIEKQRFLGDYVSRDKMLAVRDGCAKVLGAWHSLPAWSPDDSSGVSGLVACPVSHVLNLAAQPISSCGQKACRLHSTRSSATRRRCSAIWRRRGERLVGHSDRRAPHMAWCRGCSPLRWA